MIVFAHALSLSPFFRRRQNIEANAGGGESIQWHERPAWVDTSRDIETNQEALALLLEP